MARGSPTALVGVISDTHGPLPPGAAAALSRSDHIVHAGDIVSPRVLPDLRLIAPVTAVRGNMDRREAVGALGRTAVASVGGVVFYVLHDIGALDLDPGAAGFSAVIHGHTHQPQIEWRAGVLYLNPGSAARPRGGPPTIAVVEIGGGNLRPRIVCLD